jgi:hypothetical protein
MPYVLGPVKPWVKTAAEIVGGKFDVSTIYGVASRSYASDHPLGLALDYMVYGDKAKGDQIAAFCAANAGNLNVHYIIWYQHIWNKDRASEGWREMSNRGSATANHMDHVHVSFNPTANTATNADWTFPGIPGLIPPIPGIPGSPSDVLPDGLTDAGKVIAWLGNSHNWFRIGLILGGVVLLVFALIQLGAGGVASNVNAAVQPKFNAKLQPR